MNATQTILSELLKDISQLGQGQGQFVRSVNKYFKRNKRISDSQFRILENIKNNLSKNKIPDQVTDQ